MICIEELQREEITAVKGLYPPKTKLYSCSPKPCPGFWITVSILELHPAVGIYPETKKNSRKILFPNFLYATVISQTNNTSFLSTEYILEK